MFSVREVLNTFNMTQSSWYLWNNESEVILDILFILQFVKNNTIFVLLNICFSIEKIKFSFTFLILNKLNIISGSKNFEDWKLEVEAYFQMKGLWSSI